MRTSLQILSLATLGSALISCTPKPVASTPVPEKPVIYQVMTRLFGNDNLNNIYNGSLKENGVGKFNDFTTTALDSIHALGANYIWYTGVIAHASKTDYSAYGMPANHPAIVKGNAGSPYAIRDYYDVDPDLATDVNNRMQEFEELVKRSHASGLKVLIDFIPNHVAREYKSAFTPEGKTALGSADDTTKQFAVNNNFYYLPGQQFSPQFDTEGYIEKPAKATGNDVFSPTPNRDDWYETVKLNYGVDYEGGRINHFDSIPATWTQMKDILLFWSSKGIDGFRTDMAEMVPVEFWEWAIPRVKESYPNLVFIAEIYNPDAYRSYIRQGKFDYLYDKVGLYDTLKYVIQGKTPASAIAVNAAKLSDIQNHMLNFLENHDEQRIASDDFAGTPEKGIPMMIVSAAYTNSPVMFYFGQELGEKGEGAEGFGGDDGRTTIFDYYGMKTMSDWRSKGSYSGEGLNLDQKKLQAFYKRLLNLLHTEPALAAGDVYDLTEVNLQNPHFNSEKEFAFLRQYGNELVLGIVNFSDRATETTVVVPAIAFEKLGVPGDLMLKGKDLLSGDSENALLSTSEGYKVHLAPYSGKLIRFTY